MFQVHVRTVAQIPCVLLGTKPCMLQNIFCQTAQLFQIQTLIHSNICVQCLRKIYHTPNATNMWYYRICNAVLGKYLYRIQ